MTGPEGRKASVKDKDALRMYVDSQEEFDEWRQAFKASVGVVGPIRSSLTGTKATAIPMYERLLSYVEKAKSITDGIVEKISLIGTDKDTEELRRDMYRERVEMQQGKSNAAVPKHPSTLLSARRRSLQV
jgi:hypothetical protein